ncbi:MAG: hypothetical protein WCD37_05880 [Chloroflexia bacterium]
MDDQTNMANTSADVNDDTAAASQDCPKCGMPKAEWRGNGGQGFQMGSTIYCCQGCATDTGCTCD